MGTEVLRPQDCLAHQRIRVSPAVFPRRKNCSYGNSYSSNPRPNRKQQQQQAPRPDNNNNRRRAASEPAMSKRSSSDDLRSAGRTGLVMEKVTILRRGESLDSKLRSDPPAPRQARSEYRSPVGYPGCDVYAGSAFAVSPEPSALPLPSFFQKKLAPIDDSATRDLRRLLRLD